MNKKLTSIRLTQVGAALIKLLAQKLGVSKSAVLELAIRKLAREENIKSDVT